MIGILGLGPIGIGIVVAVVTTAASVGTSLYIKNEGDKKADAAEKKNDAAMAKAERKAYVMNRQQLSQAIQAHNMGTLMEKKELIDNERKQNAPNYGSPVTK
ncbi:MAG: hypothetical protein Q7T03_06125 [Deltaproteobacteria bacterium]|nr:hypothetical protein [Deltaproteobacteria bacterium]